MRLYVNRVQIAHMKSAFSGDIFVEDITVENISKRRLIFGNNRNAIQTEYIFTVEKKKKNKNERESKNESPWNTRTRPKYTIECMKNDCTSGLRDNYNMVYSRLISLWRYMDEVKSRSVLGRY